MKINEPLVGVILVNYNGGVDTIECLESLFKLEYKNLKIVVVDNASTDASLSIIHGWAEGKISHEHNLSPISRKITLPPYTKPLKFKELIDGDLFNYTDCDLPKLTLLRSSKNLGFAGANNLATRFLLSLEDNLFEYFWYLNNDTVVEKNALSELTSYFKVQPKKLGILGSKLKYYHAENLIQAVGASYNPVFATVKHIGCKMEDKGQFDHNPDAVNLDYVVGASMFVSKAYVEEVGLMSEDYFLYFEEIDWVLRGKKKGFKISYCPSSIVYHKEGASIGAGGKLKEKSKLSDYYSIKNRIRFSKKFYPNYMPFIYLGLIGVIINRLKRRQFDRISFIIGFMFGKL